ncbi:septum formation initiator family protein [Deinococcus sp. KNUC1210]|uniref:septum formation initiator family protein n=1 Tax=Deinococcus sp. KNUC1210 TaxID=2917691 RepID=UPI001EF029AE|nr:septum formation initiator family protein [Deinococcus sp. KNUC1210]ULH14618.1 septum formation initiator family protein [Deinococcus sp. KNUC1210]
MRLLPSSWKTTGWKKRVRLSLRLPAWSDIRRFPVSMMLACLLAGLGSVQMTFLIGNSLYRSYTWTTEHHQIDSELRSLNVDLRVLRETQARANDPEALRAQARCLGFVGKGETVVVAENAPSGINDNCDAVRMP